MCVLTAFFWISTAFVARVLVLYKSSFCCSILGHIEYIGYDPPGPIHIIWVQPRSKTPVLMQNEGLFTVQFKEGQTVLTRPRSGLARRSTKPLTSLRLSTGPIDTRVASTTTAPCQKCRLSRCGCVRPVCRLALRNDNNDMEKGTYEVAIYGEHCHFHSHGYGRTEPFFVKSPPKS
jgi:hypothetical protein